MGETLSFSFCFYRPFTIGREYSTNPNYLPAHIFSDHDGIDYTLSKVLAQDVRLMTAKMDKPSYEEYDGLAQREKVTDESMPPQTFFDIAVIHLLTTSTIDCLRELYPEGKSFKRFEVRRFRPNIVVELASGEKDFIENSWIGKKLTIGEDIVLRVTGACTSRGTFRKIWVSYARSQSTTR